MSISQKKKDFLVLGADSVIDLQGQLISKPKNREEAMEILRKLNGKKHNLISSVCISKNGSMIWHYTDRAILTMKNLTEIELKDYLSKIKNGWTDVDKIVATPDMMGELGKLGKILGPKGLMPNPKSGTVTMDVGKAVRELKAGQVELRVESNGIIHVACGKTSFDKEHLVENIKTIYDTIIKARPASVKGDYFTKMTVSSSMGPGITIDHIELR